MDWIVIANPVLGKGRGKGLAESVVRFLANRGVTAEPVFTARDGDGTRLARQAVAEGIRQVAVCGGDGTVHEVVNGLVGSDTMLGVVPSAGKRFGTGAGHSRRCRDGFGCVDRWGGSANRSGMDWRSLFWDGGDTGV